MDNDDGECGVNPILAHHDEDVVLITRTPQCTGRELTLARSTLCGLQVNATVGPCGNAITPFEERVE